MAEKIKFAAVRAGNHIITGETHSECLQISHRAGFPRPDVIFGQGFLTTKWRFVLRREALQIATREGQIVEKHNPQDQLLSEDLEYAE